MRIALVLTLGLLLAAQQLAPQNSRNLVSGRVMRAGTADPVSGTQVTLITEDPETEDRMTQTDGQGRFAFSNVAPGRYEIRAQREGYFGPFTHAVSPRFVSKKCEIRSSQPACSMDLSLIPAGSISGRILDPQGIPVPRAQVSALQFEYREGRRMLISVDAGQTDERGEYRLFRIGAGRYYIVAGDRMLTSFAPDSSDVDKATLLNIGDSVELRGVNVQLRSAPTVRIRGTVRNDAGQPSEAGFSALSQDALMFPLGGPTVNAQWLDRNAGQFEIRGIQAGVYELAARGSAAGERGYNAHTTVRVGRADVENVALTLYPPVSVTIHTSIEGKAPIDLNRMNFQLVQHNLLPPFRLNPVRRPDSPDVVTFVNVPQAIAVLHIFAPYPDAYPSDMRMNGRSIFNDGFIPVGTSPVSIDLIVNGEGGRIHGSVQGAPADRVEGARVVLVPQGRRRQNSMLYQNTSPNPDGSFTFRGVAPGSYKVFVWESVLTGAWENAEFLAAFESRGRSVTANAGKPAVVKVQWIPNRDKP